MLFPRFSSAFPLTARFTARLRLPGTLLLSGALWVPTFAPLAAQAQTAAPNPLAPAPAPRLLTAAETAPLPLTPAPAFPLGPGPALPLTPDISILLLAIDDLPAPGGVAALPPAPGLVPGAAVPGAAVPGAIVPADTPPPAITPAGWRMPGQPFWLSSAQKKKNKDDDLFKPEPDYSGRGTFPGAGIKAPAAPPAAPAFAPAPTEPLGRTHSIALTLRRALLGLGYRDVSLATPNTTLISDALAERRLTPRALSELRAAFADIAAMGAAPSAEGNARATLAATRIGQALGYRAVAAFHVAAPREQNGVQSAPFSLYLADTARESGEPIFFEETGASERAVSETGASSAAERLDKTLRLWPATTPLARLELAAKHLASAKTRIAAGDTGGAQEELSQVLALDPTRSEPLVLLGDLLAPTDPVGAASAYRRAVEIDARDGATFAKIAVAYSSAAIPDWPRALEAGRKAIATGFDSVPLRVAMATAQYGRADLFRQADRQSRAEDAELEARTHLERALELAPEDPFAVRLLARRLVEGRRFSEAIQTLDQIAPRYPNDVEIQTQYAAALGAQSGREEDAFVASSRVWKMTNVRRVDVDAVKYRSLAQGFDARLFNIGKTAVQLTTGVANAALPREDALLQLNKLKEEMGAAENAIAILRPPISIGMEVMSARQFAATLMAQALEQQQIYLETGQSLARLRGSQLYTQSVAQLNAARLGR